MSTYEPGRLYLIDVDGETHEARYFSKAVASPGFLTRERQVFRMEDVTNVRPAIVLDPEDEDVQTLMRGGLEVEELDTAALSLVHKIRAQITPPEPPMEEPTEWGAKVTDDRGDWLRAVVHSAYDPEPWAAYAGGEWSRWDEMQNPRPFES